MIKKKLMLLVGFLVTVFAVTEVSAFITIGFNHVFPVRRHKHVRCYNYYPVKVRTCHVERYVEPEYSYEECDYVHAPYYSYYEQPCRYDYQDYSVRKPRRSFVSFGFGW